MDYPFILTPSTQSASISTNGPPAASQALWSSPSGPARLIQMMVQNPPGNPPIFISVGPDAVTSLASTSSHLVLPGNPQFFSVHEENNYFSALAQYGSGIIVVTWGVGGGA